MSFQWHLIAAYLYTEIIIVSIILLPIFSPRHWYTFFRSRIFSVIRTKAGMYFYVLLGVLTLFLFDAIRDMTKYSELKESKGAHLASELKGHVKLFRAQRNFYITGFAIFLSFIIRRLITMTIIQHELQMKADEIIKKADETVNLAKTTIIANRLEKESDVRKENEELKHDMAFKDDLIRGQKLMIEELEEEAKILRAKCECLKGDGDNN